jgi:hypothetical protein
MTHIRLLAVLGAVVLLFVAVQTSEVSAGGWHRGYYTSYYGGWGHGYSPAYYSVGYRGLGVGYGYSPYYYHGGSLLYPYAGYSSFYRPYYGFGYNYGVYSPIYYSTYYSPYSTYYGGSAPVIYGAPYGAYGYSSVGCGCR